MRSERFGVLIAIAVAIVLIGLGLTCLSPSCFFAHPDWSVTLRLFAEVVFAPPVLLARAFLDQRAPAWLIAIAVIAIVALPFHPLRNRSWTTAVTAAGFFAWFSCQVLVALVPA